MARLFSASTAFTTVAPVINRIALDQTRFADVAGGAVSIAIGKMMARGLRDGFSDRITSILDLPSHWTSMNVDVEWTTPTAVAGAVVYRFDYTQMAGGDSFNKSFSSAAQVTSTAGAQYIRVVSSIATAVAVSSATPLMVGLIRLGTDAADTLAATAAVTRIILTNANA